MLKFIRKYQKWMLAIGMSFLAVTFLLSGPQSVLQPKPEKRVVAKIGTEAITVKDLGFADREYEALKILAPRYLMLELGAENSTHWMLLTREAQKAGLVGSSGDGTESIQEIANTEATIAYQAQYGQLAQYYMQTPQFEQDIAGVRARIESSLPVVEGRTSLTTQELGTTLSKARGIRRMKLMYLSAPRFSDRRVVLTGRRIMDTTYVDAVFVPARIIASEMPEPAPEQITRQFETYRTAKPGTGDFGFGYMQPKRVKLEWIEVERSAIEGAITVDPIAVNKAWQSDRATYPGEFAAEKPKIEQILRDTKVDAIMAEIDRVYKSRVRSATRKLEVQQGLKVLPSDWESQRPKMDHLADEIVDALKHSHSITIARPSVTTMAATWTPLTQIRTLRGIGMSQVSLGSRNLPVEAFIGGVNELSPSDGSGIQAGVPVETPSGDGRGSKYYFTVLAAAAEAPAESLDEVRTEVVRDVRLLSAFRKLESETPLLQATAASDGLEAVVRQYTRPSVISGQPPETPREISLARISRENGDRRYPELDTKAFRDAAVSLTDTLGPLTDLSKVPAAQRIFAVAIPEQLGVAIGQLAGQEGWTQEDMHRTGAMLANTLSRREVRDGETEANDPFNFESLKRRLGYKAERDADAPAPEPTKSATATGG